MTDIPKFSKNEYYKDHKHSKQHCENVFFSHITDKSSLLLHNVIKVFGHFVRNNGGIENNQVLC